MKLKVEKGIPLPPKPPKVGRESIYPWEDLPVGGSFLIAMDGDRKARRIAGNRVMKCGHGWYHRRKVKVSLEYRVVDDGVRIWRTA